MKALTANFPAAVKIRAGGHVRVRKDDIDKLDKTQERATHQKEKKKR